ncbi:SDR family NAD(P)-dependent oxidoreductase [Streptomyces sp. NBC_01716]|uniref:SDR family NAD(P)-dependent oxidoreductase n=1 Tax=Streptomyces sp. NBC_01716 TaxID=2975917 RepID=UPI002E32F957|nr:SDR family oxidoreductase [Streptomyces sp. NBC_01716]
MAPGLSGPEQAGTARDPSGPGHPPPRTALVTGASSGIGAAIARRIAAEPGWRVVVSGRDQQRLEEIADLTSSVPLRADLATSAGAERLVTGALDAVGHIDVLVVSAGVGWAGSLPSMPEAAVDEVLTVNLTAAAHLVRLVLPGMLAVGRGQIVLVGSTAGTYGVRQEVVYSAAKAGIEALADSLRYELRDTGVRVLHVVPAAVDTPFFERRGTPYTRGVPRPLAPERVAEALWDALTHGRDEVFVPRWLGLPRRLRGMAPGLFRRLASRFG